MDALILVHGWGFGAEVWRPLRQTLQQQAVPVPLLSPALPGYDDTPPGDAIEYLQALVERHDRVGLIGWSLGGLLAIELAARQPDRIARLGLIAALPRFARTADWSAGWSVTAFAHLRQRFDRDAQAARRYVAALSAHGDAVADNVRRALDSAGAADGPTLAQGLEMLAGNDRRRAFAALELPISVWLGEYDALIGGDCAMALQALRPATCIHALAAGHAPLVSQPCTIARHIMQEWF